jgi:hypothetical protein
VEVGATAATLNSQSTQIPMLINTREPWSVRGHIPTLPTPCVCACVGVLKRERHATPPCAPTAEGLCVTV